MKSTADEGKSSLKNLIAFILKKKKKEWHEASEQL